jgi:GNAT superfamily N-acetyltransferase
MYISTETVKDLIDWEKTREYLCIYENNNIIWYSSFRFKNTQTLWLSMFYIDVKYQKSWFWSIFLKEIEKIAKDKGALVVVLETDENAIWSVNFYRKNKYITLNRYELKKYPFDMVLEKDPVKGRYIFWKIV